MVKSSDEPPQQQGAAAGAPSRSPARRLEENHQAPANSPSRSPSKSRLQSVLEKPGSPMLGPERSPERRAAANRMMPAAPALTATKATGGGVEAMRVERGSVRRPAAKLAELGIRALEPVLCLVSFSVMAAGKTAGWAGDSFDRYREFRFCLSMNVIGFAYSGFQLCAGFYGKMKRASLIDPPLCYYFDFFMDQVMAYMLMSASSSAAARNDDWISMFGGDKFTGMMNASVAVSFLAFFAFAFSSIISAAKLFGLNP